MIQDRARVIEWLKQNVSEARLEHILGVEATSKQLARLHQVDQQQAAKAGLMHDLAKFFPPLRLLQMATAAGLEIDSICQANPHLLHADVSAIVAKTEFGIKDREILEAIAVHTLGKPEMSPLSCVVFVADAIEPSRGNSSKLSKLRQTSQNNLYLSVQQTCDYSLKHLIKNNRSIHPRVILTRNWAMKKVRATS